MSASPLVIAMALAAQGPAPCVESATAICLGEQQREAIASAPVIVPVNAPVTASAMAGDPMREEDAPGADGDVLDDEIVVVGTETEVPGDPVEELNAATYEVSQAVDKALVEPIADVYEGVLPKPVRNGIGNVLSNLGEPINALHFLLQLKPGKAAKSLGRFAINSTIGVAGLIDVAKRKPFNLEYEDNGLANTLGYYGIGPGPYLYLPGPGSTTVRDFIGDIVDIAMFPAIAGKPFTKPAVSLTIGALNVLEGRVDVDEQIKAIREQCGDPYAASRDIYLAKRAAEIAALRGKGEYAEDAAELENRLLMNCDFEVREGNVDFEAERAEAAADEAERTGGAAAAEPTDDTVAADPVAPEAVAD